MLQCRLNFHNCWLKEHLLIQKVQKQQKLNKILLLRLERTQAPANSTKQRHQENREHQMRAVRPAAVGGGGAQTGSSVWKGLGRRVVRV